MKEELKIDPWNTGDLWVCEEHPDRLFPDNDPGCAGPGMPALTERERSLMKQAREIGRFEGKKDRS